MKKDVFNGKIKKEYIGITCFSIVLATLVFIGCAVMFLCIGLFQSNVEDAARIAMYVVSGISGACAVVYPAATIACVRTYPKHKKLTRFFVKEYVLVNDEQIVEQNKR